MLPSHGAIALHISRAHRTQVRQHQQHSQVCRVSRLESGQRAILFRASKETLMQHDWTCTPKRKRKSHIRFAVEEIGFKPFNVGDLAHKECANNA